MAKNLVIVESPAKAKTIKKFLGTGYDVIASQGHVRDLPKSQMGVSPEDDFEPKYITIRGKGEILSELRKAAKKADKIYLATDPDREGEAISWHLQTLLKLNEKAANRITFNEITKNAIKNSIKNPRRIDMGLVDAQQARRVLDRIVGYKISPLLWSKIKSGLSAGRVQSVALRLICEREKEINDFVPEEYWSLDAVLNTGAASKGKGLAVHFYGKKDERIIPHSEKETDGFIKTYGKKLKCIEVKEGEKHRKAPLPFTTSTLQQEASKVLNFSTKKTMQLAQTLYEGVEVEGHGTIGLITYLRTDSIRVSAEADAAVRNYIGDTYGKDFVTSEDVNKGTGKKIQDAHEAIRPSYVDIPLEDVKKSLSRDLFRLYQLIWKRFVASRMKAAEYKTVKAVFESKDLRFTCSSSKLVFGGFMSVYSTEEDKQDEENDGDLSKIKTGATYDVVESIKEQHFTQPPAHFTEASLVKTLEELRIGRPSTYAPTITTILARHYILKEKKNLYVTELGEAVNSIMVGSFPEIVDTEFTALMEDTLDSVETGDVDWKSIVRNFYPDLENAVKEAESNLGKVKVSDEETDIVCEQCGRKMVIKYGPHGKFLACPGFPECRNTKSYNEKTDFKCPKCGGEIVIMKSKKGRRYYSCTNHPACDFMSWQKPEQE
ncbi:MAG: type I DNA topoisomerase [Lachnospiraceae bacterium]|nr:type I DNA topoisomerase [Lachnospiraceae bacterium]MBR4816205.1 type I DNA topoisomerase [Lachnospiraceae bacterium]